MSQHWSRDAVALLIDEYKKHSYLYQVKSPLYHNRMSRRSAERMIANVVSALRPNTTPEDVKAKINGLRTQFTSERNKLLKCVSMGASSVNQYTPAFIWYERMRFLEDYVTQRGGRSRAADELFTVVHESTDEDMIKPVFGASEGVVISGEAESCDTNDNLSPDEVNTPASNSAEEDIKDYDSLIESCAPIAKKPRRSSNDDLFYAPVKVYNSMVNREGEDEDEIFAKFIANEMRTLKDRKNKLLLKHSIQQLLMKAQIQELQC